MIHVYGTANYTWRSPLLAPRLQHVDKHFPLCAVPHSLPCENINLVHNTCYIVCGTLCSLIQKSGLPFIIVHGLVACVVYCYILVYLSCFMHCTHTNLWDVSTTERPPFTRPCMRSQRNLLECGSMPVVGSSCVSKVQCYYLNAENCITTLGTK